MKINFSLSIIASLLCVTITAQKPEVPMVVEQTFLAKYPEAKKIAWEQEDEVNWEVEFKWEGIAYSVTYDANGNRLETSKELKENEIPEKCLMVIKEQYPGFSIDEAEWIESVDGIFYEFELKGKEGEIEILTDSNGKIVSSEDTDEEED